MLLAWLYAKVQAVTPYSFRTKCPLEVLVTNDALHHCNRHSWNHQEQPESCAVSKISPYKLDIHCLNRAVSTERFLHSMYIMPYQLHGVKDLTNHFANLM